MNNNEHIEKTVSFINKIYDGLSYFDLYGTSVIIFVFLTLFVFAVYSYCLIMQTKETISDDWINQRCKPQNMLFAGLITHPEGTTPFEYTSENFSFCVQDILKNISNFALEPLQFMIKSLTQIFTELFETVQRIRENINKMRNNIRKVAEDVLSRILNFLIPIQKMVISLVDAFQKIQGVMTAGLYTMLGTYYTLQSLMGAILELIVKLLVTLVIIIVGLWVTPFTWPVAASMSAVFLAISVPLTIIIYFMSEVLHIKTSAIPKLRCFDENTEIQLLNGNTKHIKNIEIGDILYDKSFVTSKIKVTSKYMKMYNLNGIIVSESHLVKYDNKWMRVGNHPHAINIKYEKDYLFCLNTSNKLININNTIFSDWDEIIDDKLRILNKGNPKICKLEDINNILDKGFKENTLIELKTSVKQIKEIKIGDVLKNNAMVYGLVELKNNMYHLLTTDGSLIINSENVKDYNNLIDIYFQ